MRRGHRSPPLVARALLKLLQPRERRAEIESDLWELFERRLRDRGARYASWRYCADVLSLWRRRHRAEEDESVWMAFDLRDVRDDVRFAVRTWRDSGPERPAGARSTCADGHDPLSGALQRRSGVLARRRADGHESHPPVTGSIGSASPLTTHQSRRLPACGPGRAPTLRQESATTESGPSIEPLPFSPSPSRFLLQRLSPRSFPSSSY
jgi:hypothetical protein